MKVVVYNQQNQKAGEIELSDVIFKAKWNADLVHQALIAYLSNKRKPWAHAKTRSEVRGGGKKPWRQKGTGRARHGSIRSPLWAGGGATHGPLKERDYSKKLNKKMRKAAIFSVLSKKIADNEIKIIDKFENIPVKTKEWQKIMQSIADLRSRNLVILENANKNFHQAIKNIKKTETISPKSLNIFDLMRNKNIIIEAKAIEEIEKHYMK